MDRMEDQESKFVCKWCDKRYPCGKSLGGHMRSHIMAISAESEHKVEANMKKLLSMDDPRVEIAGQTSYGLRENPKKTFKVADATFPLPQEKVCKQCGKGFQSLKALCGHMACHSERDRGLKDDHSWTSENQKLVMDDYDDEDDDDDSESDMEAEEEEEEEELEVEEHDMQLRNRSKSNKRYKRIVIKSSSSMSFLNGSSSVSEVDDQEQQEEVAICLMMLSRDSGSWGGVNSVVESSDNNSVVLEAKSSSIDMRTGWKECLQFVHSRDNDETTPETKKLAESSVKFADEIVEPENSDSGYFLGEYMKLESDASVDGLNWNKPKTFVGDRFEETLADIRKSSNQMKGYKTEVRTGNDSSSVFMKLAEYESRRKGKISSENLRQNGSSDEQQSKNGYKRSKYECLNCKKTFSSYQALGGHRPCHKRTNAYLESRYETGENSYDGEDSLKETVPSTRKASGKKIATYSSDKKMKSSKNKKAHECPFCHRVFKNGQALGGHKRSHFLGGGNGGAEVNNNPPPAACKSDFSELLDLNLPAPLEDEGDGQYMPW